MLDTLRMWLTRASTRALLTDVLRDTTVLRRHVQQEFPKMLDRLEKKLMDNMDTLQAAVERNGAAVAAAVDGISGLRTKVGALEAQIASGELPEPVRQRLAAITASIDAQTDAVAQALIPVVADPETPTAVDGRPVEMPLPENPATADPADVPGSVPAGEPLPDDPERPAF